MDPGQRDQVVAQAGAATFLHLWNEMFRRGNDDKHIRPPRGSYLHELMADYGMLDAFAAEYEIVVIDGVRRLQPRSLR